MWRVVLLLAGWTCAAAVVSVTGGCGPSSAELAQIKAARYRGSAGELYAIARQTAAETYKIGDQDPTEHRFVTQPQWYSEEGGRQSVGAGDMVQIRDRSVRLELLVEIETDVDDNHIVIVTPITHQHVAGSPQPRELAPDDPYLPPWVSGRVDALALAIHQNAQSMLSR